MNEMKNELLLSVSMITFKHELYIKQAIEGVLMQETNFEFHLIIADDCSPDATPQIVKDLIDNHPNGYRVKYFRHEKNMGMQTNGSFALQQCKGKYVAVCEGDDYWTDPLKLQKQVDFLEANNDYVIHSGNAIQFTDDLKWNGKAILSDTLNATFQLKDFLSNNNIITCTTMFRNIEFNLPKNFSRVTFGDWFLYVILIKNSGLKVYRSIDLYSVYRVHPGGVMSNLSDLENCSAHILQITIINNYLKNKKLGVKQLVDLNDYSLRKYRLQINNKLYFGALKTVVIHFKYARFEMPFKKYLNTFKHLFA
ncbi:glycosyltransferase family 2 protein [Flavobacterium sp. LB2P44]|uniref:glycosyltransferase family 2 protein n=1 Tax=Flavobacterium sp. LB2P44 TaxID=3401713 RepID=UPI003AACA22C